MAGELTFWNCFRTPLILYACLHLATIAAVAQTQQPAPDVAVLLHKIDYFDAGCAQGLPIDQHYAAIEAMGLAAIPTLLQEIMVIDFNSKVGPNGYIWVASCLIERIAGKAAAPYMKVSWRSVYEGLGEGRLLTEAQRRRLQDRIIRQLADSVILLCRREGQTLQCGGYGTVAPRSEDLHTP